MKVSTSFAMALLAAFILLPAWGWAGSTPDLPELISEALSRNREVLAARAAWRAAGERPSQAGALPDPQLSVGVMNLPTSFRFDEEDMTMKQVQLSQMFPWYGKRDLRGEAASQEAEAARQRYIETANRVVRELREVYYELFFVAQQARLVEANLGVLSQFVEVAKAAYVSGTGTQADMLRAQTQHARMIDERLMVERERVMVTARLMSLLDQPAGSRIEPPENLPATEPPSWSSDELLELALEQRPMLKEAQAMTQARRREIELARKEYWPDVEVMVAYGQRGEVMGNRLDDMLTTAVSINVPLWRDSKLDPMLREAKQAERQAAESYQSGVNEIEFELWQALAKARRARESLALYDTGILPQARLTVESSLSGYRVGKLDFLSLTEAQMNLYASEVARARALTDYSQAVAEIDYIIGSQPLEMAK
ncbi:TolC family protein [Desulfocurvibacter africanus]|uniref:TolC family protein n=1 Tax=Desulfocurvibacter africanus TaxID=873 RepID=UPI00041068B6|nr:TolC family protein [Desulfocurvibacter africanus]